jgi:hypothetical protein
VPRAEPASKAIIIIKPLSKSFYLAVPGDPLQKIADGDVTNR